jgi:hypothetical protein
VLLAAFLCGLVLVGVVTFAPLSPCLAQGSPHYGLSWSVIAGGGGTSQSSHYVLNGTGGQGVPGVAASAHYRLGSGFWYAFGIPALPGYKQYLPLILKRRS